MAEATGQDIYGLCLCLERFPEVYEAFRNRILARSLKGTKKEGFQERRERTRLQRIRGLRR